MTNQERLEKYLVGYEKDSKHIDGYLEKDISNGKVIMLSGKWGSGKTHFWQNEIQTVLNDKEKKIPNHYISLYGKTSIQEIKNEVFLKIFESVDSLEIEKKSVEIARNTTELASNILKTVSFFGFNIDLTNTSDKPFDKLNNLLENKKLRKTEEYLNSGAIICFDDFERKSKDIDLNDLFGFITQLTLNFQCKVVIILNDDVFEGKEKDVFSRVKEKTVSKFLKYEPSIKELFDLIFEDNGSGKYFSLVPYKEIILKTIEETEELNARIYIQVLDNLVEWINSNQEKNDEVLRCLILVNINFILNHKIVSSKIKSERPVNSETYHDIKRYCIKGLEEEDNYVKLFNKVSEKNYSNKSILDYLINSVLSPTAHSDSKKEKGIKFISDNKLNIYAINFLKTLDFDKNISEEELNKINNFIETGILIND